MKKLFLVLVIVLSVFCSCTKIVSADKQEEPRISVSGSGTVILNPDIASFTIQISETEETTKQAQNAVNKKISDVITKLEENGVEKDKLTTLSLNINTVYHWDENNKQVRDGERVSQSLRIILDDISVFSTVIDEIGQISGITISNVNFDVANKQDAMEKARELAFEDAKAKALTYCEMSGLKLSKPISISEYNSTRSPKVANMKLAATADGAVEYGYSTEIPSGDYSVYVNVDCVFEAK